MVSQEKSTKRRGMASTSVIATGGVVVLLAAGAWWLKAGAGSVQGEVAADTFEVRRGSFDITVPTSGELAALRQIEIKNQLDSRAVITEIVDEGVRVKAGDVLIRFNDDQIRDEIRDAEDSVEIARNDLETAVANLEIRKKTRESRMAEAELDIMLAELALRSWEEGFDKTTRQDLELRVKTAEKEYQRAYDRYEAAKRLRAQEFLSEDDLRRDEITLLRAESDLEKAKLEKQVYEEYDSERLHKEKLSDHQQARDEYEREKQRLDTEVRSAESDVRSRERRLDSREERLARWKEQLERCTIIAPSEGLVVYASSLSVGRHGRGDEDPPQVGAEYHPNRTIMVLPDVSQMIAAVKVNEALSGQIEPGQRATVVSDALPDTVLTGEVLNVGVLAESGGWRDPNRRDYTVRILLDGADGLGLKPSMRCKATIAVGRVEDALHVPIQAIFRDGPTAYVYAKVPGGWSQKAVDLGRASELYVEIGKGLDPGDIVLLREATAAEIIDRLDNGNGIRTARGPGAEGERPGPGERPRGDRAKRGGERGGGEFNRGDRPRRPGDGERPRGEQAPDGERPVGATPEGARADGEAPDASGG